MDKPRGKVTLPKSFISTHIPTLNNTKSSPKPRDTVTSQVSLEFETKKKELYFNTTPIQVKEYHKHCLGPALSPELTMKGKAKPPMSAIVVGTKPEAEKSKDSKTAGKDKKKDDHTNSKISQNLSTMKIDGGSEKKLGGAKGLSRDTVINGSGGAIPKKQSKVKVPTSAMVKTGHPKEEPKWPSGVQQKSSKSPINGKGKEKPKEKPKEKSADTKKADKQVAEPPKSSPAPKKKGKSLVAESSKKAVETQKPSSSGPGKFSQASANKGLGGVVGKYEKTNIDQKKDMFKSPKQQDISIAKAQDGKQKTPSKPKASPKTDKNVPKTVSKSEQKDLSASKTKPIDEKSSTAKDSAENPSKTEKTEQKIKDKSVKEVSVASPAEGTPGVDLPDTEDHEMEGLSALPPEEERADEAVHVLQSYLSQEYWDLVREAEELDYPLSPVPTLDVPTLDLSSFSLSPEAIEAGGAMAAFSPLPEETGEGVLYSKTSSFDQPTGGVYGYVMSTNLSIKESDVGCTVLEKPKSAEKGKVTKPVKRCIRRSTPEEKESAEKMHGVKNEANEIRDLMDKLREQMSALDAAIAKGDQDDHTPPPEAQLSYVFKINLKQDTSSSSEVEEQNEG